MRFNLFLLSDDIIAATVDDTFCYQGNCCTLAYKRNMIHQMHLRGKYKLVSFCLIFAGIVLLADYYDGFKAWLL